MKNQKKQLIILLGILAVCVVGYFAAGAYADRKEAADAEAGTEYTAVSFESSEVVQLEINGSAGTLLLAYDSGSWSFLNDISAEMAQADGLSESETAEYEVNATTANTILGYLEEITSEYEITPEEELSAYGLEDPSMTVAVTMEDGTVLRLVFGDCNEMLGEYYFYVDDADTLYTMSSYTYNILNKSDTDLADEVDTEEEEEDESGGDEETSAESGDAEDE